SRAAACAGSMQSSAAVRAVLGEPVTLAQLSLGCDVGHEPACRRTEARGQVSWRGVELTLPFTCLDDAVEPASVSTSVAALKPLVDSKVFAAWIAVASGRRMLEPEQPAEWRLRARSAPEIWYHPSTRTLDVLAQDQAADAP